MRKITSMLAAFLFLCPSAFADSAEQSELLGWIKKLSGLIESKSTTRAVPRAGRLVLIIPFDIKSPRIDDTTPLMCTASMSLRSGISYSQTRTALPTLSEEPQEGRFVCVIQMDYNWPHVDPTNMINLNVVVSTVNSPTSTFSYHVSHDLPGFTIPRSGTIRIVYAMTI